MLPVNNSLVAYGVLLLGPASQYCDSAIYYCDSGSATYSEILTGNLSGLKHMDTLIFRL